MYPKRNNIYEAVIRRMVTEGLEEKNRIFAQTHREDTDEALLSYVRSEAQRLGHTPYPNEIIGGEWIQERFGSWPAVIALAALKPISTPNTPSKFQLIMDEVELQRLNYRKQKIERRKKSQERVQQQKAKKQK